MRLPTRLWVEALLRRVSVGGASGFVLQRGDEDRGNVLVKVSQLTDQAKVFTARTDLDGTRIFVDMALEGLSSREADIDAYLQREMGRDRDLWIIEIEDRDARHFLTEPVKTVIDKDSSL